MLVVDRESEGAMAQESSELEASSGAWVGSGKTNNGADRTLENYVIGDPARTFERLQLPGRGQTGTSADPDLRRSGRSAFGVQMRQGVAGLTLESGTRGGIERRVRVVREQAERLVQLGPRKRGIPRRRAQS